MSDNFIDKAVTTINTYTNLSKLRAAIRSNEYNDNTSFFTRLLIWKSIIITETLNIKEWDDKLFKSRAIYSIYQKEFQVPYHKLSEDHPYYKQKQGSSSNLFESRPSSAASNVTSSTIQSTTDKSLALKNLKKINVVNDPLSTDISGYRGQIVSDIKPEHSEESIDEKELDILRTIVMDVERLFPGERLYMDNYIHKKHLVDLLFIWNKLNSTIGYKQGMHEIIGLIYLKLYEESIDLKKNEIQSNEAITRSIINLYDYKYLKHDIFIIFNNFMMNLSINYFQEGNLIEQIEKFDRNLIKIDQNLYYNLLSKLKIDSQFWLIRYYRLLLIRELGTDSSIKLWDKLISLDNWEIKIIDVLPYTITMLVINIKKELIMSDFGEALYLLLHYPVNNSNSSIFIDKIFQNSVKLLGCENDDAKLYKLGLKLNQKYNPDLGEKKGLEFDKMRLEMRLKKKVTKMMQ